MSFDFRPSPAFADYELTLNPSLAPATNFPPVNSNKGVDHSTMSCPSEYGANQPTAPVLDYGCTKWRSSSQRASDMYDSGLNLWRKEDFVDIERQLAQSRTAVNFTVRRLDGSLVHIKNPMFGIQTPIWKPTVKFQEYWRLVRSPPDVQSELYNCTYYVEWLNQTLHTWEGPVEDVQELFESTRERWNASVICETLKFQFRKLLSKDENAKKVNKIICFGLGDINAKPPDWWRMENDCKPDNEREPETAEGAFLHHAVALTMADIVRSHKTAEDSEVRLITQDPAYSDETRVILRDLGFEVVGEFGAGGFAELDDECIVFSPFVAAPVKQIIADFARPVAVISVEKCGSGVYNHSKDPWADPESPRTRQMWDEYETWSFAGLELDPTQRRHLHQLELLVRRGE